MNYEKLKERIGGLIKIYRKRMGYTQDKLEEITNISQQDIQNYESALTLPRLDILIILAEALQIPPDKIFNEGVSDNLNMKELGRTYERYNDFIEALNGSKDLRDFARYYLKNTKKLENINFVSTLKKFSKIPKNKK